MWPNENGYDALIRQAVHDYGNVVPVLLVKAMIGVESGYKPTAYRNEPKIGDASRGLMQILYRTAQAAGYNGTPEGLLAPETNIAYGVKHLSGLVKAKGDLWAAVSAYNNGSGAKAKKATTVCLARDQKTGECIQSFTAQPGQFLNQPYVDKVRKAYDYFRHRFDDVESGTGGAALGILAILLGGWLLWR